jgi:hypothetical protein
MARNATQKRKTSALPLALRSYAGPPKWAWFGGRVRGLLSRRISYRDSKTGHGGSVCARQHGTDDRRAGPGFDRSIRRAPPFFDQFAFAWDSVVTGWGNFDSEKITGPATTLSVRICRQPNKSCSALIAYLHLARRVKRVKFTLLLIYGSNRTSQNTESRRSCRDAGVDEGKTLPA